MLALDLDIYLDLYFGNSFGSAYFSYFFKIVMHLEKLVYHDHSFFVLFFLSFLLIVTYLFQHRA